MTRRPVVVAHELLEALAIRRSQLCGVHDPTQLALCHVRSERERERRHCRRRHIVLVGHRGRVDLDLDVGLLLTHRKAVELVAIVVDVRVDGHLGAAGLAAGDVERLGGRIATTFETSEARDACGVTVCEHTVCVVVIAIVQQIHVVQVERAVTIHSRRGLLLVR